MNKKVDKIEIEQKAFISQPAVNFAFELLYMQVQNTRSLDRTGQELC